MRRVMFASCFVVAGCGNVSAPEPDAAVPLRCDPMGKFGVETPLGGLGTFELQQSVSFVAGETTAYVALAHTVPGGGAPDFDIYKATRARDQGDFMAMARVDAVSTTSSEPDVAVALDGTLLVLARVSAAAPDTELYASAIDAQGAVGAPVFEPKLSKSGLDEGHPNLWGSEKTLYFTRYVSDTRRNDLFYAARSGGAYLEALEVPGVNLDASAQFDGYDNGGVVASSGLQILFSRDDVMQIGVRASVQEPFSVSQLLDVNGEDVIGLASWLSEDGCRLYYARATYGTDNQPVTSRLYTRARSK